MNPLRKLLLRAAEPPLNLSVSVSDVMDYFYQEYATLEEGRYWWWVQMILLDPNEVICNDGYDNLYRMSFETVDRGPGNPPAITFGDPVSVRLEPVDTTVEEEGIAARHELSVAACAGIASVRGRERVAASYQSRDESRPTTRAREEEQVREHIKKLRARLGLGDDVSDEQVLAAAATRLEADAGEGAPNQGNQEGDESTTTPTPPTPPPTPPPPPAPGTPSTGDESDEEQPVQARTVDAAALRQLQEDARLGREAREAQLSDQDNAYVDAAIREGKFPPRMRASYLTQMGRSPESRTETRAFIDELDENVVPVAMRGNAGDGPGAEVTQVDGQYEQFLAAHMPDIAAKRQAAIAASGEGQRVRVLKDSDQAA